MTATILRGDALEILRQLPAASVRCCVTSPPYWGLRDYGTAGQLGLEDTPEAFVANMVAVFAEVRRILMDDGTLWLNLGDSYYSNTSDQVADSIRGQGSKHNFLDGTAVRPPMPPGARPKNLVGIPWRTALALQADGWYLRSDIIWHKPNPMPESVTDRPTKSHEYIFLLTKSPRYYYNAAAIAEPLAYGSVQRLSQPGIEEQQGSDRVPGKTNGPMKPVVSRDGTERRDAKSTKDYAGAGAQDPMATKARIVEKIIAGDLVTRNKRTVWTVPTQSFKEAHFATFPPALIEPCILAGSAPDDVVLDPFAGSGTTGVVALHHRRQFVGVEINPEYAEMARRRILGAAPLLNRCEVRP